MPKRNKPKARETVDEILQRLSERMFPAQMGQEKVTIESREADGDGVLHNLLYGKERYPVLALIEAGADVNAIGNLGYAPLHVSAFRDDAEMIQLLLDAGADPRVRCEIGKTPLDAAVDLGCLDAAKVLKSAN
ncbi:ankyrin repeat domain-containing protein [uncultured Tateyamaria sp.]|uniref:ankyrin repeat domain-containing protein n=1 Tax=uncultured Tateyamaria sp. TaxID=455651 RepID=UPI00261C08C1|nr:ankyrin repeat domain-containing protein [uncultured Tateyamaria sp.]